MAKGPASNKMPAKSCSGHDVRVSFACGMTDRPDIGGNGSDVGLG